MLLERELVGAAHLARRLAADVVAPQEVGVVALQVGRLELLLLGELHHDHLLLVPLAVLKSVDAPVHVVVQLVVAAEQAGVDERVLERGHGGVV
jgi:hypothetical protein